MLQCVVVACFGRGHCPATKPPWIIVVWVFHNYNKAVPSSRVHVDMASSQSVQWIISYIIHPASSYRPHQLYPPKQLLYTTNIHRKLPISSHNNRTQSYNFCSQISPKMPSPSDRKPCGGGCGGTIPALQPYHLCNGCEALRKAQKAKMESDLAAAMSKLGGK